MARVSVSADDVSSLECRRGIGFVRRIAETEGWVGVGERERSVAGGLTGVRTRARGFRTHMLVGRSGVAVSGAVMRNPMFVGEVSRCFVPCLDTVVEQPLGCDVYVPSAHSHSHELCWPTLFRDGTRGPSSDVGSGALGNDGRHDHGDGCVALSSSCGGWVKDVLALDDRRAELLEPLPLVARKPCRRGRRAGALRAARSLRRSLARFGRCFASCEVADTLVDASASASTDLAGLAARVAAVSLQRAWRRSRSRSCSGREFLAQGYSATLDNDGLSMAVCIQRLWRAFLARRGTFVSRATSGMIAVCERSVFAATLLQQAWRRRCASLLVVTSIEAGWHGAWAKRMGALEAHVRALQWLVRGVRSLQRGEVRWAIAAQVVWAFGRRARRPRCGFGANLAGEVEFASMRQLSAEWMDHYTIYVQILQRLESGETPSVLQAFCGGGGQAEGQRRAGGCVVGTDLFEQPDFCRHFSAETFVQGDSVDWAHLAKLRDSWRCFGCSGGPPCKSYSKARVHGEAKQPPLIEQTRDAFSSLFDLWSIENVMGARSHLSSHATELDGALFGLRVARSRLYETNFELVVDEAIRVPAKCLRDGMCLGQRRRWRSFDEFGRPVRRACCGGNIFAPLGERPWRCTAAECAVAMGVDVGHMSYERLAQSVPPAYGQLVFAQMCMHRAHRRFGVPILTYDDRCLDPAGVARQLSFWLTGAGAESSASAVFLEGLRSSVSQVPCELVEDASFQANDSISVLQNVGGGDNQATDVFHGNIEGEAEFRELFYSHAGGFSQQLVPFHLSRRLHDVSSSSVIDLDMSRLVVDDLVGENTYIEVSDDSFDVVLALVLEALEIKRVGTRVTLVSNLSHESVLHDAGFQPVECVLAYGQGDALRASGRAAFCAGRRGVAALSSARLDYEAVRAFMDSRDASGWKPSEEVKRHLTWEYMPHDPERWKGIGLPEDVELMMTEGLRIEMEIDCPPFEIPQYPFLSGHSLLECANELNRALCVGAFEFVPDEELSPLPGIVHPFTMDLKGDKWRACCDYKAGTNQGARSGPFGLPHPFDVRKVIKPESFMVKYDLRDGFWSVPIHPASRNRLILRHPISGRLVRAARVPFGFVDSPRAFCRLTESIAQILRKRMAGKGVHVFTFVDDFLIVSDDEATAREAGQAFEDLLEEVGLPWAPHKQRGPCQAIEFLGLFISNVPGMRMITLSRERQGKLREMIDDWQKRRPHSGELFYADPVELARFLGKLVFASQVVMGGRTYMQGMLSQFKGLEVDWKKGEVRPTHSSQWRSSGVAISAGFWRDLEWWNDHLESRCGVPLDDAFVGEGVIAGTDASDWGTGQLAWLDGQRAEEVLKFSSVERRRSINWRELLGILRVIQRFGVELRGRCLLVETDNTSAKGAADKRASKAEDSQELIRRLLEAAEAFDIHLKFIHTPGVKLVRPDQTSRGQPIEEPRVRLSQGLFQLIESRFGPFDSIIGGERRFARPGTRNGRVFVHPTHTSVATALRVVGERMMGNDGERASGVLVVPWSPSSKWWSMLRHFSIVGQCFEGEHGRLEMNQLGVWRPVKVLRSFVILAFPHAAGNLTRPVRSEVSCEGYVSSIHGGEGFYLPLLPGSFVYSPSVESRKPGHLYRVWREFDPAQGVGLKLGDFDAPLVAAVELRRVDQSSMGSSRHAEFRVDRRSGALKSGQWGPGSFSSANFRPWEVDAHTLWTVDHLVEMNAGQRRTRVDLRAEEQLRFFFDFRMADRAIRRVRAALLGEATPVSTPSSSMASSTLGSDFSMRQFAALSLTERQSSRASEVAVALCQAAEEEGVEDAQVSLERARESAREAVEARRRPPPVPRAPAPARAMPGGAEAPVQPCRFEFLSCAGCHKPLGLGTRIRSGGKGMVHASGTCWQVANDELRKSVAQSASAVREARGFQDAESRRVQFEHRLSDDRKVSVLKCLRNECFHVGERLMCRAGCGRGLHTYCAQISSKTLGNLICAFCRSKLLVSQSCSTPERLVERAVGPMMIELTSGATSTHHGYADFVKLEKEYQIELAGDDLPLEAVNPPHSSEESFLAFLEWLVTDGGRARSFGTTVASASGFMTKLEMTDWTKSKRVKSFIKELDVSGGAETVTNTPVTRMMVDRMVSLALPEITSKAGYLQQYFLGRALVALVMELGGGARVGEATGDLHGMKADNTCVQRLREDVEVQLSDDFDVRDLGETIEMRLEDSKTYIGRYLNIIGESRVSRLPFAEWLRDYWQICGISVDTREEGPFVEERPDYSVVRVSFVDMPEDVYRAFIREVRATKEKVIADQQGAIVFYANKNREAKTLGEHRRYVNLTGGRRQGQEVLAAYEWMERRGWGRFTSVVKGPLLRASWGKQISHMPLEESGVRAHVVGAMRMSREIIEQEGLVDPEFDAQLGEIWGTHSLRRQADRVATRTRSETKVSKLQINMVFGWELKKIREEMQQWYAGLDRLQRLDHARVTMML